LSRAFGGVESGHGGRCKSRRMKMI
jgi:hypothetical protein